MFSAVALKSWPIHHWQREKKKKKTGKMFKSKNSVCLSVCLRMPHRQLQNVGREEADLSRFLCGGCWPIYHSIHHSSVNHSFVPIWCNMFIDDVYVPGATENNGPRQLQQGTSSSCISHILKRWLEKQPMIRHLYLIHFNLYPLAMVSVTSDRWVTAPTSSSSLLLIVHCTFSTKVKKKKLKKMFKI